IFAMSRNRDRAHVAEPAQSMMLARVTGKFDHFQRAAQVHIQTRFFRLAVERGGDVDERIGSVDQAAVIVIRKPELRLGEVTAENVDARQVMMKSREVQMKL